MSVNNGEPLGISSKVALYFQTKVTVQKNQAGRVERNLKHTQVWSTGQGVRRV